MVTKDQTSYLETDALNEFIVDMISQKPYPGSLSQSNEWLSKKLKTLCDRYPQLGEELLADLKRFFIISSEEFRKIRSAKSLLRLVISYQLLREKILREVRISPGKRHLFTRLFSSQLFFPFGKKTVLGVVIAVYLSDRYDFFDEQHIHLAIEELSPSFQIVPGSFFSLQTVHDKAYFLYIEVEKEDGSFFLLEEHKLLRTQISQKLKKRIERLSPSIFMRPNIEEKIKNILVLGQEIRSTSDIPQITISLEKQTVQTLFFTVMAVCVEKKGALPIAQLFKLDPTIKFSLEHEQIVGFLNDGSAKKAYIFQLHFPRSWFLRYDSSTNFYTARDKIVSILYEALGEIRDYNGGMFLKQGEALAQLKEKLPTHHSELIEDLFYSITPIEMQVVLPFSLLHNFLQFLLEISEQELLRYEDYTYRTLQGQDWSCVVFHTHDFSLRDILKEAVKQDASITFSSVIFQEKLLVGYLCFSSIQEKKNEFFGGIQEGLEEWKKKKKQNSNLIRLYYEGSSYSLDPRLGGDVHSTIVLKALFEGLTRRGKDGSLALAIADKITISDDLKRYTFRLREALWSNGDLVSAYDFEYAWKKILSPDFNSSFAYLFYPLKNAQAIKKGELALSSLGVHSLDNRTLSIELEDPCPPFLELLSHVIYSPVNHYIDERYPNWFTLAGSSYVCNGPFYLLKSDIEWGRYELAKNPHYWDASKVQLDRILLLKADAKTAFEMFTNDEIDWLGRPVSPWDISFSSFNEIAQSSNSYTVYWYVFNVQRYPFHNKNLRKAVAHAIDRKELLALYPDIGTPAITPLPLPHTQHRHLQIPDSSPERATDYLEKGLKELGITQKQLPSVILSCPNGEIRYQMTLLVKRQIEQTLGLTCHIQVLPWEHLFTKMLQGDYQFGSIGWTALVNDPFYTLNVFKNANEGVNFAKWEHPQYQALLDAAAREMDPTKRQTYIAQSEALLMEEIPLIPIYYETPRFLKKSNIFLLNNQEIKDMDFKWISARTQ